MKYHIGDAVRVPIPPVFRASTPEQMNEDLRCIIRGEVPDWLIPKYNLVVLTTQEMVDEYNKENAA